MAERTTTSIRTSRGRRVARWCLIIVESLIAIGAVYGGIGLIAGNSIGMLPEWLDGTPFTTWLWPGIFLLLVVAAPMAVAAAAEFAQASLAYALSLIAGTAQVGWIVVQWLVMQRYFFLQPMMLVAGLLVVLLAWASHRGESPLPGTGR